MRSAVVLVILAACGGGVDFTVDPLPACPTCTMGHVRAAATAPRRAAFSPDGARLAAYGDQHVAWLDATLATVETGDTDIPVKDYVAGPFAGPVMSAPDGRAVAAVSGTLKSGFGSTMSLVGLDAGGQPTWHTTAVDAADVPPTWLYAAPDGTPVVVSNTLFASLTLGTQTFNGWILIAKLSHDDGSVTASKVHSATMANVTATAIAPDGGIVIAGTVDGSVTLGGTAPKLTGGIAGRTLFIAGLDANGDGVWAKTWTGTGPVYVGSVATDGQHVYASGTYTTSIDFGDGHTLSSTDPLSEFVIGLDATGTHAWSITLPANIGAPTLATTPNGVLFSGSYFDATTVGGISVPLETSQAGLVAELVDGNAAWLLTATGAGDHMCTSVGTVNGHTYVMVDAQDAGSGAQTTFDSLSVAGEARVLAEIATAGGS